MNRQDLSYHSIASVELPTIINPTTTTLYLQYNDIDDIGAEYLSILPLKFLDLSNNYIGPKGAKYLATNKTIKTLYIDHNNIGPKGVKYLAANKIIRELDISATNIGITGNMEGELKCFATNYTITSIIICKRTRINWITTRTSINGHNRVLKKASLSWLLKN